MNKYILGLNGWFNRSHDASACIVLNGEILVMAEEERFTRKKHAYDKVPLYSVLWCLDKLGLTLDDISEVAVGWDYKKFYSLARMNEPKLDNLVDVFFPRKYFKYIKKPRISLVPHHLAHAASSFYLSGFDKSSILVVDGQGEDSSTTFAIGDGNKIKILWSLPIKDSLGYFYEAISDYVGLGIDSAGKTMGLAPYGNPNKYIFPQFIFNKEGFEINIKLEESGVSCLDKQQVIISAWRKEFIKMFKTNNNNVKLKFRKDYGDLYRNVDLDQFYKDVAASAQLTLEKIMEHLVTVLIGKTKIDNVCLAGGVTLNCSTNTKIYDMNRVKDVFVPPFANDAGVAVGAALYVGGTRSKSKLNKAYFGPSYTNTQIHRFLNKLKIKYTYHKNIEEVTAKLLQGDHIVSWFQGEMETGPRALGNRSIIANPILKDTHRNVNNAKDREQWRPLAPSILDESGNSYLDNYFSSPFMLHTFNVKDEVRDKIPSIVHIDGSTRPQSVSKKTNPRYYKLIKNFEKLTGIPIILNTSFNGAKEPIVCTPLDAISSFYTNSTEYLVLGNYLIKK